MKYYIATSFARGEEAAKLAAVLEVSGHEVAVKWWECFTPEQPLGEIAEIEIAGVLGSDALIVLLPGMRGTHTEFGLALGAGRPVYVLGALDDFTTDRATCVPFYHHPLVWRLAGNWASGDYGPLLNVLKLGADVPRGVREVMGDEGVFLAEGVGE